MTSSHNLELRKEWEERISDYKAGVNPKINGVRSNGVSYHQFGCFWNLKVVGFGRMFINQFESLPHVTFYNC